MMNNSNKQKGDIINKIPTYRHPLSPRALLRATPQSTETTTAFESEARL
jgi:hypothetical protein